METKTTKEVVTDTAVTAPAKKKRPEPEVKESKSQKLSIEVEATQFNFGDTRFAGQEAKMVHRDDDGKVIPYDPSNDEAPFVMVPYAGGMLKVDAGSWLVKYPDGTQEVWSDLQHKAFTGSAQFGTDPFDGPIWRDQNYIVNYPQPGRANPNEVLKDGTVTSPGHPDNPLEAAIPTADGSDSGKTDKDKKASAKA